MALFIIFSYPDIFIALRNIPYLRTLFDKPAIEKNKQKVFGTEEIDTRRQSTR